MIKLLKKVSVPFLLAGVLITPAHADLRNGLIAWWSFDEASGTAAYDYSGSGNTATASGTTIINNCRRGNCRRFNGSSDYLSAGTTLSVPTNVTISVWIYPTALSGLYPMIITRDGANNWEFTANDSGTSRAYYGYNGGILLDSNVSLSINQWYHYVLTIDSTAGAKIYINTAITNSIGGITSFRSSSGTVYIGRRSDGHYFSGLIDDVRIYNRALTATEVSDLYRNGVKIGGGSVLRGAKLNQ